MPLIVYKGSLFVLFTQLSPPVQIDRRASTTRSRPLTELLPGLYTLPPVSPPYNPIFLLLFSIPRFSADALPGLLPLHPITQFSSVSFLYFGFSADGRSPGLFLNWDFLLVSTGTIWSTHSCDIFAL